MISCLILYHEPINKSTAQTVIRSSLQHKDYNIVEEDDDGFTVYIWNVTKQVIWQIVFYLEFSKITVGYGFGNCKKQAEEEAILILEKRDRLRITNE